MAPLSRAGSTALAAMIAVLAVAGVAAAQQSENQSRRAGSYAAGSSSPPPTPAAPAGVPTIGQVESWLSTTGSGLIASGPSDGRSLGFRASNCQFRWEAQVYGYVWNIHGWAHEVQTVQSADPSALQLRSTTSTMFIGGGYGPDAPRSMQPIVFRDHASAARFLKAFNSWNALCSGQGQPAPMPY